MKKDEIGIDVKSLKVIETMLNGWSESDPDLYKSLEPKKGGNRKTRKRFIKNK